MDQRHIENITEFHANHQISRPLGVSDEVFKSTNSLCERSVADVAFQHQIFCTLLTQWIKLKTFVKFLYFFLAQNFGWDGIILARASPEAGFNSIHASSDNMLTLQDVNEEAFSFYTFLKKEATDLGVITASFNRMLIGESDQLTESYIRYRTTHSQVKMKERPTFTDYEPIVERFQEYQAALREATEEFDRYTEFRRRAHSLRPLHAQSTRIQRKSSAPVENPPTDTTPTQDVHVRSKPVKFFLNHGESGAVMYSIDERDQIHSPLNEKKRKVPAEGPRQEKKLRTPVEVPPPPIVRDVPARSGENGRSDTSLTPRRQEVPRDSPSCVAYHNLRGVSHRASDSAWLAGLPTFNSLDRSETYVKYVNTAKLVRACRTNKQRPHTSNMMACFPLEQEQIVRSAIRTQTLLSMPQDESIYIHQQIAFALRKRGTKQDGRRKGNLTTPEQYQLLEATFQTKQKPNAADYTMLAKKTSMPKERLKERKERARKTDKTVVWKRGDKEEVSSSTDAETTSTLDDASAEEEANEDETNEEETDENDIHKDKMRLSFIIHT
ncbi:hypothetical protein PROFUN_08541 [Planoprotostelium fungivorum]|uniref:Homeobox domain-containing protein n=1 Tax=Planoprotostelium fungivorum TaxID=1890364 RepID=A0A2P6N1P4_9EUKA|nr:hypothetical protein PROFUN_08541 [Planoprotostelium fungivorum]